MYQSIIMAAWKAQGSDRWRREDKHFRVEDRNDKTHLIKLYKDALVWESI